MHPAVTRDAIVQAARSWLGTPYHHQAALSGVGCDCLGLVRGVWRTLYGDDVEVPASYSRDWADASGVETMLDGAARHLIAIAPHQAAAGDVLIFRLRTGCVAKHAAILSGADTFVHAMEGGPVSEVVLSAWWRRRIAGAFQFPSLTQGP